MFDDCSSFFIDILNKFLGYYEETKFVIWIKIN